MEIDILKILFDILSILISTIGLEKSLIMFFIAVIIFIISTREPNITRCDVSLIPPTAPQIIILAEEGLEHTFKINVLCSL